MFKYLCDFDGEAGKQHVMYLEESGRVLIDHVKVWDEREDGPLDYDPSKLGGYKREGDALVFDQAKKDAHDLVANAKAAALQAAADAKALRKSKIQNVQNASTLPELKEVVAAIAQELGLDS